MIKGSITTGTLFFDDGNYSGNTAYDFTGIRASDNFGVLRLDVLGDYWPYTLNGASRDGVGTYQPETGEWRVITTIGGDFFYIYWNKIVNGVSNKVTLNITAISGGELKFENGANVQSYTTPGLKTFTWTGDGGTLNLFTNSVNCLISDFKIELI